MAPPLLERNEMLVLGLDFETTGLNPELDRVTEIGAVLWCTERRCPVEMYSQLIFEDNYPEITKEITEITGIDKKMLDMHAVGINEGLAKLVGLMSKADAYMAHNAEFDKNFFIAEMQRNTELKVIDFEKPWIDSQCDLPYPNKIKTRKLEHLAAEHKFLNPFSHRALFDVLTMFQVFNQYSLEEVLRYATTPNITVKANVKYDTRHLAKEQGFRWNGEDKQWEKVIKEFQLDELIHKCSFGVKEL